jgi:hypothetical protein
MDLNNFSCRIHFRINIYIYYYYYYYSLQCPTGEAHLKDKVQDSSYDLFANVRFKQLLILGIQQTKISDNSTPE